MHSKRISCLAKDSRLPPLHSACDPVSIKKALLLHFLSLKGHLPSANPLTNKQIVHVMSKSSPSSTPSPDDIPYLVWKKVYSLNSEILLDLLLPLVSCEYHPATWKKANGVILDKPGRRYYQRHQQNVKTSPGPPRGVMVPLVLLVNPDPPWSTFSVKFQKVWIRIDRSGPGGPWGP